MKSVRCLAYWIDEWGERAALVRGCFTDRIANIGKDWSSQILDITTMPAKSTLRLFVCRIRCLQTDIRDPAISTFLSFLQTQE